MKTLAVGFLLVVGLFDLWFHRRITDFQMKMYRRYLPAASGPVSRFLFDCDVILVGLGFVAAALGYFFGVLR